MTGACRSTHRTLPFVHCIGLVFLLTTIAHAQPADDAEKTQRLPDLVLGTWPPNESRAWYGDLVINEEVLTWAACVQEPYRVIRFEASAWLIELVNSPACPLPGTTASPWWVQVSRNGNNIDLWVQWACKDVSELEKPRFERQCQTGHFSKGAQPAGKLDRAERLPDQVRGAWAPMSHGISQYGELVIRSQTLTWATCVTEPYRVMQSRGSAWLIELVNSPACPFPGAPTSPWWLEVTPNGNVLDLSLHWGCKDVDEIEKPRAERECNRAMLSKVD